MLTNSLETHRKCETFQHQQPRGLFSDTLYSFSSDSEEFLQSTHLWCIVAEKNHLDFMGVLSNKFSPKQDQILPTIHSNTTLCQLWLPPLNLFKTSTFFSNVFKYTTLHT